MGNKAARAIDRVLDARVSPTAYLLPMQSLVFGIAFALFSGDDSVRASFLFQEAPPFGAPVWGASVTIGIITLLLGMLFKKRPAVYVASLFLFFVWLGAAIEQLHDLHWLQFMLTSTQVVTYTYFFFANWTDKLWDYCPTRHDS